MKKSLFSLTVLAFALAACDKNVQPEATPSNVVIEPVITRALSLNFKPGNKIGLDIVKADGTKHAENACLTYSDGAFSSDLKWYAEGGESCSLAAYYPYQEDGFPATFTVAADQSAGTDASDLMIATKDGVYPRAAAELMVFRHMFSQLVINIDNSADVPVSGITLKGLIPTATVSATDGVSVDASAAAVDLKAEPLVANRKYCAVVVPQEFKNLGVVLHLDGASAIITGVDGSELVAGYSYTINLQVSADNVSATISGEIEDWIDGGSLTGGDYEPDFEEFDGYFVYDGKTYTTARMKDGKVWMTQNLAYVPFGLEPCADLSNVKAGVYMPIVVNADHSAAEFSSDPEVIATNGYLYQEETALGVPVGSVKTIAAAEALNGAQGICPKGWHVPTDKDFVGLIGKIATYVYGEGESMESAPYYDPAKGNASIDLLNEDGFNADAWGAVSIADFTKEAGTFTGWLKTAPDIIASGFVCGSTYASVTYNTKDTPDSGIKNIQFWGLMPMANNGSFNGAKNNIRTAAPLRCVKDAE